MSSNPGERVLVMKAVLLPMDRETERQISRSFMESPSVRRDQMDVVKLFPRPCFFLLRWQEETTHLQNQATSLLQKEQHLLRLAGWKQMAPRGKAVALPWNMGQIQTLELVKEMESL